MSTNQFSLSNTNVCKYPTCKCSITSEYLTGRHYSILSNIIITISMYIYILQMLCIIVISILVWLSSPMELRLFKLRYHTSVYSRMLFGYAPKHTLLAMLIVMCALL